jgi:lysophospholipase L1-like esterase
MGYSKPSGYFGYQTKYSLLTGYVPGKMGQCGAWLPSNSSPPIVPPSQLPGLVQWFDGRVQAYSDAGVTPANAPFGRIAQMAQPAPLTGNWTGGGSTRGWRDTNAIDCHAGESTRLQGPALAAVTNANNFTLGISLQVRSSLIQQVLYAILDGIGYTSIQIAGNNLYYASANVLRGPVVALPPSANVVCLVLRFSNTQVDAIGTVDGIPFSTTISFAPTAGALSTAFIGDNGIGLPGQTSISQLVLCNQVLTNTDRTNLLNFLIANAAQNPPSTAPLMVWAGDSIGAGFGLSAGNTVVGCVNQTALVGNPTPPRMINPSVSGATIADVAVLYPTVLRPLYNGNRLKNILIWQVMTNSLNCASGNEAATSAAALAAYYAACDIAKAQGWINVLCTCLPSTSGSKGTGFDAARLLFNANVTANYLAHGSGLSAFGAAPGMANAADANGANFQADHLHVTAAGYTIMSGVLTPVITALL